MLEGRGLAATGRIEEDPDGFLWSLGWSDF